jgi:alkylation response protein AidB-like acyl-CoA dehydrogenase
MATAGITVRPIETMDGAPEFSEVFFDDVPVPFDRTLGDEGQGWAVAMDLLPYERSTALWHRAAFLHRRLQQLLDAAPPGSLDPARLGEVTQLLYAFRARSRTTQHRLHAGAQLGPETSIDKVLVATVEQAVFDLVEEGLAANVTTGDDPSDERWRSEFLYSRAATIYGGSAEIQRNIIARRLLDLGSDR